MRRLQRTYRPENVWFLAFDDSRAILEVMAFLPKENLITIPTRNLGAFVAGAWAAMRRIWSLRIDTVLDLEFFSRASALIAWLSGARRRVGAHNYFGEGPGRGRLMTHGIKFNPHLHISQMFQAMAEAVTLPDATLQRLEFTPPPLKPIEDRFIPTPDEQAAVDRLLRECGWNPGERIVLLNSNISDRELIPLRKWDEGNYAEVGRQILAQYPDTRVLLTGAPGEAEAVQQLERSVGSPRCRSVAGRTSLRELFTLYTRAVLMVTNDSGPAHFATLADLPVVVLFGPESPSLWTPLGRSVHVVYRGLACSPAAWLRDGSDAIS